MKKFALFTILLLAAWAGMTYINAGWTRHQFISEVDSLLETPRDLSESNLPSLILNKAVPLGITLNPEEVKITTAATDRETTVSRLMQGKGVSAENRVLTLEFQYHQSVMGFPRSYTLTRQRFFTVQAFTPTPPPLPEE